MPEYPEVGVVKDALKRKVLNKRIEDVKIYWNNVIATSLDEFNNIKGEKINDISRKGKYIIFILDHYDLIVHLRMEGKFFYRDLNSEKLKHDLVIFNLGDFELRYNDTRKFGKMYLLKKEDIFNSKPLNLLGPDPYDDSLTKEYLKDALKNKNIPIKTALLDQHILTGIGNIYADEILFMSKIYPLKKSKDLSLEELQMIIDNTRITFKKAYDMGGTTIKSYSSEEGVHGKFQRELLVHTKLGYPCPNCKTKIIKEKVNGRSTYYCPNCQKNS